MKDNADAIIFHTAVCAEASQTDPDYRAKLVIWPAVPSLRFGMEDDMAVVKELIRKEESGALSFGNYELDQKTKVSDFEHQGDLYKVKTFYEITKLEKNGMFVYESVPGTSVFNFELNDSGMEFQAEGKSPAQITLGLEPEAEYKVFVNDTNIGKMQTILGGKLVLSLDLEEGEPASIRVIK